MNNQISIKSIDELIKFIEINEVSKEDIAKIISKTVGVYTLENDKEKLVLELKKHWNLYKDKPRNEQPLFLTQINELWK